MTRRERITLVGVLLEQLAQARAEPGEVRLTRLAMRTNLPYDRFQQLFHELQEKGLISKEPPYALTPAGRDLLEKYKGLNAALRDLGLRTAQNDPSMTHDS